MRDHQTIPTSFWIRRRGIVVDQLASAPGSERGREDENGEETGDAQTRKVNGTTKLES